MTKLIYEKNIIKAKKLALTPQYFLKSYCLFKYIIEHSFWIIIQIFVVFIFNAKNNKI